MAIQPLDILQQYWGYPSFRPLQLDIIESVLSENDTLALLPTGGGKSICFQVPALCREGICLVVSPLIALMKDQVANLQLRGIAAEAIFSGIHRKEIDRILDNCIYGQIKFLYVSPERLKTTLFLARFAKMPVNLIAVDEAHCVSQWGYDFRPPYLEIAAIRQFHPKVPVIGLTATATPLVVKDILEKLKFEKEVVFQKSFHRPNLSYTVFQEENKIPKLLQILQNVPGSGIVYVRNRKKTKEIARVLNAKKIKADYYHAGLSMESRHQKQEDWIKNRSRIMVATNAFGMGIDKPDVRTVIHMDLPDSLEAYFQEAGRVGRDEQKAYAVLLFHQQDVLRLKDRVAEQFPEEKEIQKTYQTLGSYLQLAIGSGLGESFDFDLAEFCRAYSLKPLPTFYCLKVLEQAGWLTMTEGVYSPATVQFLVNKEELYDYQLKNPKLDLLIKSILRSAQGAFAGPTRIHEKILAKFLRQPLSNIVHSLNKAHQDGIINYLPHSEKPQITFLQERVPQINLTFDKKHYRFRKEQFQNRIAAIFQYIESSICRSNELVAYFGEQAQNKCGICDNCLAEKRREKSTVAIEVIQKRIADEIRKQPGLELAALLSALKPLEKDEVLKALHFLIDERVVREKNGNLFLKI